MRRARVSRSILIGFTTEPLLAPMRDNCGMPQFLSRTAADALDQFTDEAHRQTRKRRKEGQGNHQWDVERIEGDDYWRDRGIWVRIFRLVDKARNWYEERISLITGEVVRHQSPPLDEHARHGADKA